MWRLFLVSVCLTALTAISSCRDKNKDATLNTPNQISPDVVNINASASGRSDGKLPKLVFSDTNYDFGSIKEGEVVTHIFTYKNEGNGELVISNATASCGCTKPSYANGVKHPGDTGTISVTFDSSKKTGKMVKLVTISTNCQPALKYLTININIQPSTN